MIVVLATLDYVVAPALRSVAPDVFVGGVGYGRYSGLPDAPIEFVHLGFLAVTVSPFFYSRLYHTELGRRFRERFEAQR